MAAAASSLLLNACSLGPLLFDLISSMATPKNLPQERVSLAKNIFESLDATLDRICIFSTAAKSMDKELDDRISGLKIRISGFIARSSQAASVEKDLKTLSMQEENSSIELVKISQICKWALATIKNHQSYRENTPLDKKRFDTFHFTASTHIFFQLVYQIGVEHILHKKMQENVKAVELLNDKKVKFITKVVGQNQSTKLRRSLNEAVFMTLCEHPNIMPLNGVLEQKIDSITVAMPYLELGVLKDFSFTSYHQFLQILFGCFTGLSYMHSLEIVHTDVNPNNLFVRNNGEESYTGVVGDLGFSCLEGVKEKCGTLNYMSPELVLSDGDFYIHSKNDVWSMGIVLFELVYGPLGDRYYIGRQTSDSFQEIVLPKKAFYQGLTQELFTNHLNRTIDASKETNTKSLIDDDFVKEQIQKCLVLDPKQRPSAAELAKTFKERIDLIGSTSSLYKTAI